MTRFGTIEEKVQIGDRLLMPWLVGEPKPRFPHQAKIDLNETPPRAESSGNAATGASALSGASSSTSAPTPTGTKQ